MNLFGFLHFAAFYPSCLVCLVVPSLPESGSNQAKSKQRAMLEDETTMDLLSEYVTHETVKAGFWPWLEPSFGKIRVTLLSCFLPSWKWTRNPKQETPESNEIKPQILNPNPKR